ncbi:MAG: 6,7-dimethyl-8-ribityllumazine synthase [Pedobacter sp.]|nr:MAG: 6,7-dimethyl-8-ribityllumazine synthase [Pedobacter sp.]
MATHLKNLSDFSHTEIPNAAGFKVGIVVAEWNAKITGALYDGAVNTLLKHGVIASDLETYAVPGSFELTAAAGMLLAQRNHLDAVICIGCVIQGDTKHFDFICDAVANGISNASLQYQKPVIFGVLTTNTEEQALDRAGGKHGNKGDEAAITAIKMIQFAKDIQN